MNPETVTTTPSILGAFKASMVVHPILWTLGGVAVIGAVGYFIFRKKPAEVKAAA